MQWKEDCPVKIRIDCADRQRGLEVLVHYSGWALMHLEDVLPDCGDDVGVMRAVTAMTMNPVRNGWMQPSIAWLLSGLPSCCTIAG